MSDPDQKKFRLRASLVDGQLELESGGLAPIADRASFEIVVAARDITDPLLVDMLLTRKRIQILPEGTRLVAAVSSRNWPERTVVFHDGDVPYDEIGPRVHRQLSEGWTQDLPALIGLTIGPMPRKRGQMELLETGGLWLKIQGARAEGLEVSSILMPSHFGDGQAKSLNHALTRISETLETWRISHTYSAYQRIFYQETNGNWYPLQWLRDDKLHKEEHEIARTMWQKCYLELKSGKQRD